MNFAKQKEWIEKRWRSKIGQINDFCEVICLKDAFPPKGQAYCYKCGTETKWRGPIPTHGDLPYYTVRRGTIDYKVLDVMAEGEDRTNAMRRLYARVNLYEDGPKELSVEGLCLWQGSLCWECNHEHMKEWMDNLHPPAGAKINRQGGTAID